MDDLLKYAVDHGMTDLSYVKEEIAMNQRKELLAKHPYKIWEGKDGKCYTYLPDKEKGRILKKKSSKESIENDIIEYWKAEMDNPTIKEVFDEWYDRWLALKHISDSSHLRNLQTYNRHFQEFGKTKIKSVKKEDVEDSRHLLSKTYVFTLFFGPR